MKTLIRVLLIAYLAWSALINTFAIRIWMERPSVMGVFFLVVWALSLVAAVFLVVSPKTGKLLAVVSQVPQFISIVTPIFAFGMSTGLLGEAGVSIMRGDAGWRMRPEIRAHAGAEYMGFVGYREERHAGFAITLNATAICLALAAFYGLKKWPDKPSPTPTSVTPPAVAPKAPPSGAAGR
jgi:hypothetical protein